MQGFFLGGEAEAACDHACQARSFDRRSCRSQGRRRPVPRPPSSGRPVGRRRPTTAFIAARSAGTSGNPGPSRGRGGLRPPDVGTSGLGGLHSAQARRARSRQRCAGSPRREAPRWGWCHHDGRRTSQPLEGRFARREHRQGGREEGLVPPPDRPGGGGGPAVDGSDAEEDDQAVALVVAIVMATTTNMATVTPCLTVAMGRVPLGRGRLCGELHGGSGVSGGSGGRRPCRAGDAQHGTHREYSRKAESDLVGAAGASGVVPLCCVHAATLHTPAANFAPSAADWVSHPESGRAQFPLRLPSAPPEVPTRRPQARLARPAQATGVSRGRSSSAYETEMRRIRPSAEMSYWPRRHSGGE